MTNPSDYPFGPLRGQTDVAAFIANYRGSGLPPFDISGPVDLYPDRPVPGGITPTTNWHDMWPSGNRAGVYMIYSEAFELLYIGKASMNRSLGQRLWDRFGDGDSCSPRDPWLQPSRFVITIGVPEGHSFEAPALEEYLIKKLQPTCNAAGK